jgi:hypothetical protein
MGSPMVVESLACMSMGVGMEWQLDMLPHCSRSAEYCHCDRKISEDDLIT